ncbi:penicillin-binding protein 1C [Affinibrenneria salicis]|uniref:peptidoglycan glycosyltransferase n=1 Tax=Affinibrenneria salicis TaxID=2590031 RepID=A0A5J5FYW4_9GAMM|nr:penicillin-binding protein 1C [Affinibrenneria salicis]KAA8999077.1 penicillin-binding protein 1C [Affinibrenneria salicis]
MRRARAWRPSAAWRRQSLNLLVALLLLALPCIGFRLWPHPPLAQGLPLSTAWYDRHGALLRLTLANDDRYRLWTPLEAVSPQVVEGIKLHEDRGFDYHPGFNPYSLLRGFWRSYISGGRQQGGSTLTMQLARMRWQLNTRTPQGKLLQVLRAVQLELSYSKRDILEAYLNYAPYGRNIESIGAASLIYFNKTPRELTLPEALTLAVLPQSPGNRMTRDSRVAGPALSEARNRLYRRWLVRHPQDVSLAALFRLPLALRQPEAMPFSAPHFIEQLQQSRRQQALNGQRVDTTLDASLQRLVEKQVDDFIARNRQRGIRNSAVLLVDTRDMGVRAMVGSADYANRDIAGQVNGTRAKRSPGSTLKPFIYALGLEQGVIHPMTILRDVPSTFGAWAPENFDRRFLGPISAVDALNYSRNIPAVWITSRLNQPNLYQFLQMAGISGMASERHYGLSLTLGGGEVSVQELARMYAMLANRGELKALRMDQAEPQSAPVRLLSDEASFITLDMLGQHRRPGETLNRHPAALPVYWKTGTSWGFRDAWSAGIFGPYVLIVWQGNFDGQGNNAFIGVSAAAPLFFNIIDSIQADYPALKAPPRPRPAGVKRVKICLASGDLATPWCQQKGESWFIPGKSPIKVDTVYRPLAIDNRSGAVVCTPGAGDDAHIEVFEFWPSDLARIFALAGLPKRAPPSTAHCGESGSSAGGSPPRITSPLLHTTYALESAARRSDPITFSAVTDADSTTIYWFVDDIYIGNSASRRSIEWRPTVSGRYRVRAIDDHGRGDSRALQVEIRD